MTDIPHGPGLAAETKAFNQYLNKNPAFRDQLRAAPGKTVAYAGSFEDVAAWVRLLRGQLGDPWQNDYQMLPDVLRQITCPTDLFKAVGLVTPPQIVTLLDFVQYLTGDGPWPAKVPWQPDGFTIWRVLSGIFMSNATGRVRILVGDVTDPASKVFFRTEIFVLERNPAIDIHARGAIHTLRQRIKSGLVPGRIELV